MLYLIAKFLDCHNTAHYQNLTLELLRYSKKTGTGSMTNVSNIWLGLAFLIHCLADLSDIGSCKARPLIQLICLCMHDGFIIYLNKTKTLE